MVTSARVRLPELGALLVLLAAIYALALACAIRGMPSPGFAIGISIDLTLTATAATWWLGVRRAGLPRRAPLAVFAVGALTARLLLSTRLPDAPRVALAAVLALELATLALIAARARRLIRSLRRGAGLPAILRIAGALEDVGIPRRLARILTTELATLPLALTGWVRRAPRAGFSIHRTHCSLAIHAVLVFLIALETIALHLLIARATEIGAWISTGCSIYAALWLVGDAHALRLGRIRVERDALVIEIARRWAAVVPRRAITAARRETAIARDARGRPTAGTLDLAIETPTVALELAEPVTARGPFGLVRTGTRIALTVDDPAGFLAALER